MPMAAPGSGNDRNFCMKGLWSLVFSTSDTGVNQDMMWQLKAVARAITIKSINGVQSRLTVQTGYQTPRYSDRLGE